MGWYIGAWKKYAVFSGRARRQEFWSFFLVNLLIALGLNYVDLMARRGGGPDANVFTAWYGLAVLLPSLAVSARRLHDTSRSAWWLLLVLLPIIGALVLLVFCLMSSKPDNRYGPSTASPIPAESTARRTDTVPVVAPIEAGRSAVCDAPSKRPWPWKTVILVAATFAVGFSAALLWSEARRGGESQPLDTKQLGQPTTSMHRQAQETYMRQAADALASLVWECRRARLERRQPRAQIVGNNVVGVRLVEKDMGTYIRVTVKWSESPSRAARRYRRAAQRLAALSVPEPMSNSHDNLVKALGIEADRWSRFAGLARNVNSDPDSFTRYLVWADWSGKQLTTQRVLVSDWTFQLSRQSMLLHTRPIPRVVERFDKLCTFVGP